MHLTGPMFSAHTSAFADGDMVPKDHTCDGVDLAPDIRIANPPPGTRSYALVMDDPDAPNGTFTHWLAYDIPAVGDELATSRGKTLKNSFGRVGYGGPCPPRGHRPHRYAFTVYAVDVPTLSLRGGTRVDLENALLDHTLATAGFIGRYAREGLR